MVSGRASSRLMSGAEGTFSVPPRRSIVSRGAIRCRSRTRTPNRIAVLDPSLHIIGSHATVRSAGETTHPVLRWDFGVEPPVVLRAFSLVFTILDGRSTVEVDDPALKS